MSRRNALYLFEEIAPNEDSLKDEDKDDNSFHG